jgi:hypothetical protein
LDTVTGKLNCEENQKEQTTKQLLLEQRHDLEKSFNEFLQLCSEKATKCNLIIALEEQQNLNEALQKFLKVQRRIGIF